MPNSVRVEVLTNGAKDEVEGCDGETEEHKSPSPTPEDVNMAYLKTPSALFKVLELVSVSVVLGINRGVPTFFSDSADAQYFSQGLVMTALIVTPLILFSHLCGRSSIRTTIFEVVFNLLMFLGFLAIGAVTVDYWRQRNQSAGSGVALGSLCLLSSLIYVVDMVLAFWGYNKE